MDNASIADDLEFDTLMPDAPFRELHSRVIDQPVDQVWESFLSLSSDEIRLLAPLLQLRGLPHKLIAKPGPSPVGKRPALELFADEGFVMLRQDGEPLDGRAVLIFGATGQFWSPAHNKPVGFDSPADFIDFDEPGNAKTVARFEARAEGESRTRLETETLVVGTDPASTKKFALYWAIIRGPSGLLRRSWLAGVDRRANK